MGYYWPDVSKEAATVQKNVQIVSSWWTKKKDVFVVEDWRIPFVRYLTQGILPANRKLAHQLRKLVVWNFLQNGIPFKKGYDKGPLRCLGPREAREVARVHSGEYGSHSRKRRLYQQLLQLGYYWPTKKKDFEELIKACHACQVLGDAIHTQPNVLQDMTTP